MIKRVLFLLGGVLFIACNNNAVFSDYKTMPNAKWGKNEKVSFTFQEPDTTSLHNLYVHIRNNNQYPFSNLFLIVNMSFPNGNNITDTLEYEMAKPNGEWLGKGFASIKESKLWYKENISFPVSGDYTIDIQHAMRKNGVVEGVDTLEGVTDVGFEIEKSQK
jgi:gliding motility-associated lipoprotein GldH